MYVACILNKVLNLRTCQNRKINGYYYFPFSNPLYTTYLTSLFQKWHEKFLLTKWFVFRCEQLSTAKCFYYPGWWGKDFLLWPLQRLSSTNQGGHSPCLGLEMQEATRPTVKRSGQSMKNHRLGVCRMYVVNGASVVLF